MPIIGISLCLDDRGQWRRGRDYVYADAAYANAVERAGGTPVHLPVQDDVGELVSRIDALVIPGGDDLPPPSPYPADVTFDPTPARQIAFDGALLEAAAARGLPILGICYGMQLMALRAGGGLHYDLSTDRPEAAPHRLPDPEGRHAVRLTPGSRLAAVLGVETLEVNSLHHQAVAEAGPGMRVAGHSPDGVIEAIEHDGAEWRIGVQWHPEKMSDPHTKALFSALVDAALPRSV